MFLKIMDTYLFITFLSLLNLAYGRSLRVDPSFLFIDEDWPINKPLAVSICGENIDKIKIISGNDDKRFTLHKINQTCANLQSSKEFDADQLHSDGSRWQSFSLLFEGGKKRRKASLDIQIVDINDNAPKFVNWRSETNVSEKQSVGSVIQRIQTFDPDTGVGGIVRFFVHGEKFSIENERCSNSYCHADLVLKSPLDYESNPIERVSIVARDGASLTKYATEAHANFTIHVIDEQDTPPTFLT
uniref:Cadherin domain-containing protein n=1 Tax=Panagrolaimus sp. PS1159 TaxID=55785 RepID=A0AC35F737_9BILA